MHILASSLTAALLTTFLSIPRRFGCEHIEPIPVYTPSYPLDSQLLSPYMFSTVA